jgi:hypothetical protein
VTDTRFTGHGVSIVVDNPAGTDTTCACDSDGADADSSARATIDDPTARQAASNTFRIIFL